MDTSRLVQLVVQHLPEFVKKRLILKERNCIYASMTNISSSIQCSQDDFIYDTEGYVLLMPTTQSNLSLFNISCDSLVFNENDRFSTMNSFIKHSTSSFDLHTNFKQSFHHQSIDFTQDILISHSNTLQRWQGLELLNTFAS